MRTIDVWAQITTEAMDTAPWLATLKRWTNKSGQIAIPTVQQTIDEMDKAGVDISILSAWHGPSGELISNQQVSEQISTAPRRFRGLASVDLTRPMDAVREIRKWVDKRQFVGVRIVPWLWGLPPNDRRYYPIYTCCVDLGVPVCTQIGHTGPLLGSETGRLIPYLEEVLLDFPELKVVGGHVGFPWIDELISLTIKFENFFVDTSAYALHRLPSNFVHYMKTIGADRVMFGTNWPMLSPSRCLEAIESLSLTDEQSAKFLSDNARRVFNL